MTIDTIDTNTMNLMQAEAWEVAKSRIKAKRDGIPSLFPTTDDELHAAVKYYLNIDIPRIKVCKTHSAPFTAFADAYFARNVISIWKASRGLGGKSALLAALTLFESLSLGAYVTLLGGSLEQAKRVHGYQVGDDPNMSDAYWGAVNAPGNLLVGDPTQYRTRLSNGGIISVLAASSKSVRGPHPQRLRVDEADEVNIEILDSALGQPMEARGILPHTVLSSTHQYPDGTMTELLARAEENPQWHVYEWCYRENAEPYGWLSNREISRKRATVTAAMWDVEFDLQEPSSENRAILSNYVKLMFDKSLGEYTPANGELLIFHPPQSYARYALGTDWAKAQDRTVTWVYRTDVFPYQCVAFRWTNRQPWPKMISGHDELVQMYAIGSGHGVVSAHDETGIGSVISDYLTSDSLGVVMVGKTRTDMLTNYIAGIENSRFITPMIKLAYSEHLYATNDHLFGSGHLPDTISAGAMWYLAFSSNRLTTDDVNDLGETEDFDFETHSPWR